MDAAGQQAIDKGTTQYSLPAIVGLVRWPSGFPLAVSFDLLNCIVMAQECDRNDPFGVAVECIANFAASKEALAIALDGPVPLHNSTFVWRCALLWAQLIMPRPVSIDHTAMVDN